MGVAKPLKEAAQNLLEMTELPDLITDRRERLAYLARDFFDRLQDKHTEEEAALDRMYESHRRWIHRLHLKQQSAYKDMLDRILRAVSDDEDVELVAWLELVMRTKRKDLVAEVAQKARAAVREVEARGGELRVDIRAEGEPASVGSCLYRDRKGAYFSFLEEFLDGYDDEVAFRVTQVRMSEKEQKAAADAATDAHIRKWTAEHRAKKLEGFDLKLEAYGGGLREEEGLVERILADMAEGEPPAAENTVVESGN
jgi:hypothetical protein